MEAKPKPPAPIDVGDVYLLIDYPNFGEATLAFAMHILDPELDGFWTWALLADDGDVHMFYEMEFPAILIRRVREGLEAHVPEQYRKSAMRYKDWQ